MTSTDRRAVSRSVQLTRTVHQPPNRQKGRQAGRENREIGNFGIHKLPIAGVVMVVPRRFGDDRGCFFETYRAADFAVAGIHAIFVQDNQALSARPGTIRGLHFQAPPHAQAKLVRVLKGSLFDVAVDLRRRSPTYGQWVSAILSAAGGEQLFVPRGFAHGYCTLEPDTEIAYKCDNYYAPTSEGGVYFADPHLAIRWPVAPPDAVMSDKDRVLPRLADLTSPFGFENNDR